jgi:hypothetical protein
MSGHHRPRQRRRRRLLVIPIVVLLLAGGTKLITMYAFAAAGAAAYDDEQYDPSETNFGRLETLNIVDPWRAHLGVGDARYRRGDLLRAETAFARALELAPDRCATRFNLAVTIEAQGDRLLVGDELVVNDPDQAGDPPSDPAERYSVALGVAEGGACPSAHPDDVGDRLAITQARILAKLAALGDVAADDDEGADPEQATESERGDSEQINELELRNESGASQREEARDRDTTGAVPDGQSNW